MSQNNSSSESRLKVLEATDWLTDMNPWKGSVEGVRLGTGVTVLAYSTDEIGVGPTLHMHPYDEIFVLRQGRALFTVGDRRIEVGAGQVVLGPAHVPHKYHNLGPGRLESIDIHVSERWVQTDLDDPEIDPRED